VLTVVVAFIGIIAVVLVVTNEPVEVTGAFIE
jgi:hypothetical protein